MANIQLPFSEELIFRLWYSRWAKQIGLNPNPDDPRHFYDYRAAWKAGVSPQVNPEDQEYHWDSIFKSQWHPNRFVNGIDTITGKPK